MWGLECVADADVPFVAFAGEGGVEAVVAVAEVELVLEVELQVVDEVDLEEGAVLEDALFAFVAPCHGAALQVGGVFFGVFEVLLDEAGFGAFEDEEAHEVEVVADGEASVEGELEAVAGGEACAEVVASHGEVVGG